LDLRVIQRRRSNEAFLDDLPEVKRKTTRKGKAVDFEGT
jgi:hypothetical protein